MYSSLLKQVMETKTCHLHVRNVSFDYCSGISYSHMTKASTDCLMIFMDTELMIPKVKKNTNHNMKNSDSLMDLQQLLMNTASLGKIALFNCIIRPFSFLQ